MSIKNIFFPKISWKKYQIYQSTEGFSLCLKSKPKYLNNLVSAKKSSKDCVTIRKTCSNSKINEVRALPCYTKKLLRHR